MLVKIAGPFVTNKRSNSKKKHVLQLTARNGEMCFHSAVFVVLLVYLAANIKLIHAKFS